MIYFCLHSSKIVWVLIAFHFTAVCYNCGKEGHLFKNCTVLTKKVCFKCSSTNHLIKDCPQQDDQFVADQEKAVTNEPISIRNDQCYK